MLFFSWNWDYKYLQLLKIFQNGIFTQGVYCIQGVTKMLIWNQFFIKVKCCDTPLMIKVCRVNFWCLIKSLLLFNQVLIYPGIFEGNSRGFWSPCMIHGNKKQLSFKDLSGVWSYRHQTSWEATRLQKKINITIQYYTKLTNVLAHCTT